MLELTAPIQHPFHSLDDIAAIFGFDRNKMHIRFPYVGVGFDSKELTTEHLIAILFAVRSRRAVTLRPTAEESYCSDCRHAVTGLMAHLYEIEVGPRPLNAYIGHHPPREQRPPLHTGAEIRNAYDRRVRVSVLHNDDIFKVDGKAEGMEIKCADAHRVALQLRIDLLFDQVTQPSRALPHTI
jgi:hypothetical protein